MNSGSDLVQEDWVNGRNISKGYYQTKSLKVTTEQTMNSCIHISKKAFMLKMFWWGKKKKSSLKHYPQCDILHHSDIIIRKDQNF